MVLNNPLLDTVFLSQLDESTEKEVWARVITLTVDEKPVEEITGRIISGGSINVDGTSAIRRSCSFSMVAKELNINDFYWGLYTKIKVEIGLTNKINSNYPDIIWFKQGTYVLTNFSTSQSTTNYTISIQGKDKMCLLNGDIGGSLTAPIDFGKIEETDKDGNVKISDIPIKDIIREGVHEYAQEPWHNIIINDLDDYGIELLDYKGSKPMYMFVNEAKGEVTNMTLNKDMECWTEKNNILTKTTVGSLGQYYNQLNQFYPGMSEGYAIIHLDNDINSTKYSIAKMEYGRTAGYRLTDITYAGDLVASPGDALTSILDKIVKMLGDFEYFYDLDGRFIFQRKKTYIQQTWNNIVKVEEDTYNDPNATPFGYEFKNNNLITSFSNNPNLANLRNDFSIWGVRKSATGAEIPIHMRYAIDHKPEKYVSFEITQEEADEYNTLFNTNLEPREAVIYTAGQWDWRELIYQMAKDYRKFNHWDKFLIKVRDANISEDGEYLYPSGYTGYEQYYIDLEGFWRQLYNPDYRNDDPALGGDGPQKTQVELNSEGTFNTNDNIYVYPLVLTNENNTPEESYVIETIERDNKNYYNITPFINNTTCAIDKTKTYYKKDKNEFKEIYESALMNTDCRLLYVKIEEEMIRWIDYCYQHKTIDTYYFSNELQLVSSLQGMIKNIYLINENNYNKYYYTLQTAEDGHEYFSVKNIPYYILEYNYYTEDEIYPYWHKNVWNAPELLNFWFDFLDTYGEMNKYSVSTVGIRPKVVNDTNIKAIYFRETPTVIFINKSNQEGWSYTDRKSGYTYIQIPDSMLSLFNISSQGKSAQNMLEERIYNDTYCIESVSMNLIPIYYLEPNTRIYIRDDNSKIDGEYIVSRFTIPLTYNGMMSISATKIVDGIY